MLDIHINNKKKVIEITKPQFNAEKIAESLHKYTKRKEFPSKAEIRTSLIKGISKKHES